MTSVQAVILGAVQGITEFLPVSSSGHLLLLQKLWNIQDNNMLFVILLHLGTLVAVVWALRAQVLWVIRNPKSRLTWMLLLALLPTAVIGAVFEEWFERLFESGITLGFEFVITGIILWWMDGVLEGPKSEYTMNMFDSLWIGAVQGIAILPALSRSGLTMAAGLWRGMDRDSAGRFSFLLSIPAILGATVMKVDDVFESPLHVQHMNFGPMLLGTITAMVTGYIAVVGTLWLFRNCRMRIFAVYVWVLAAFVLSDQFYFHHWFAPLS